MAKIINLFKKEGEVMANNMIENMAQDVINKYSDQKITIDPVEIASKIGLPVIETSFDYGEEISGAIIKNNTDKKIYVNEDHATNRQRFTIAHELGHLFLNHLEKNGGDHVDLYRSMGKGNQDERDANSFAAALLMPKSVVKENYDILVQSGISKDEIIEKLSKIFIVSKQAMEYRLINLGFNEK